MKHNGDISHGTLEILTWLSDVAVDEAYIVRGNPAQNARSPNETTHAPLTQQERLGEMTSNESCRTRDECDARTIRH